MNPIDLLLLSQILTGTAIIFLLGILISYSQDKKRK
jgi:hypothetical protein